MELLVSVNHSSDDTLVRLQQYQDPRLRVVVPPQPLSMTGHYEWCLQQVTGEWVTIIGDDDGVMPYFFTELEKLFERWDAEHVDAFTFRRAYYFWPGCEDIYGNSAVGVSASRCEHSMSGRAAILRTILYDLNHTDLPQVYTNNLVRRDLIAKIRKQSGGRFYNELNPDVYSGVAVALAAKQIVRSEFPIFWTGTSPKSVGIAVSKSFRTGAKSQSESGADKATSDRSKEFFSFAEAESFGVAPEVGIAAWRGLKSSPIFVLSALLMIPFKTPWLPRRRRLLLFGACVRSAALLRRDKDQVSRATKQQLLNGIVSRNGLSVRWFPAVVAVWLVLTKAISLVRLVRTKVGKPPQQVTVFSLTSNSHEQFPNLMVAYRAVAQEYDKSLKERRTPAELES